MAFKFKAQIRKTGPLPFGGVNAYVVVPKKIVSQLLRQAIKSKLPIPIKGTVEGKPFASTLVRYEWTDRVYLSMGTRMNSGVDIGDSANLALQVDRTPRVQPVPRKLSEALAKNTKAKRNFDTLPPSRRKEILRYLNSMKTREGLDRNITKVVNSLSGKRVTGLHSLLPEPGGRRR